MPDFRRRLDVEEWMDDFELSGEMLIETLKEIQRINRWLGGFSGIGKGVLTLLQKSSHLDSSPLEIVDLGCGGGDVLRYLARWGRKEGRSLKLVGCDANPHTLAYAQEQSKAFPEIVFKQVDCCSEAFLSERYDIVLASLFLHHFKDENLLHFLPKWCAMARVGMVISDLQRHPLPYGLFVLVCMLASAGKMTRHDGLISILRGFTRRELLQLIPLNEQFEAQISWKWAFRYQLLLRTQTNHI